MRSGLVLQGGDRLSGDLVSTSADTLRIEPYWAEGVVKVPVSNLSHYLQPGQAGDLLESFLILHLKSGDILMAREISGTDGILRVTTLWDQILRVQMEKVHAIRFYDRQRLWAQPISPDDSFPSLSGRSQLRTGGPLYQTLPISYPKSFVVEVDLQVPDEDFQVQIQVFSDESRNNLGRVVLELSERRISAAWFRRVVDQGFRVESWQTENPVKSSQYHLRLFGDMDKNQYSLYLNEQLIKTWEVDHMSTLLGGSSTPIQIRSTAGVEPIWLNSLRVLNWKGDAAAPAFLMPATHSETVLILADGRKVPGTLDEIIADSIRLQPVDQPDVVAYDRAEIVELVFPASERERTSPPSPESLRIFTSYSDERIQVERLGVEHGTLRGHVDWTEDELVVPMKQVQVLDFKPGQREEPPVNPSQTHPHHLRLLNGDQVSGTYLGQYAEQVIFQPGWQTTPLHIHGKYVDRLLFGHRPPPPGEGWTLTLSNGDTLSGQLLEKIGDQLLLKTKWSDSVRIRMPQIVNLRKRLPGENLRERGPSSMDDWVYSNRRDSLLAGEGTRFRASTDGWWLYRRGMVQKRLSEVQESFRVSVHIHLPTTGRASRGVGIALTALPNEDGGYRMLQLTQRADQWILNVTDPRQTGSQHSMLSSVVPNEDGDIYFEFEFDHTEKHIRIRANGLLAYEWREPDGSFTTERYQPMITFSVNGGHTRVLIREWRLYDLPAPFLFQSDVESSAGVPQVWLSNGDQLQGAWRGLSDQGDWLITPEGSAEAFVLAAERIQGFDPAVVREERIVRKASHVRLVLNGGIEEFVVELVAADAEGIRFRREGWSGEGTVPMEQVERVEFNPYWRGARGVRYPEGGWIRGSW